MSTTYGNVVRDVMSSAIVTAVPEMTLREALDILLEAGVRSAPVLDASGKTVGLVSQDDAMRAALLGVEALDALCVGAIMGAARPIVTPGHTLRELLRCFLEENQPRALVIEDGILVGVVTPLDALRALSNGGS
jgi:CBS domain-containing protein